MSKIQLLYNKTSNVVHVLNEYGLTVCGQNSMTDSYITEYTGQSISCIRCFNSLPSSEKIRFEKKVRRDKKIRVNTSLSQESHALLTRYASMFGVSKTSLATFMIEVILRDEKEMDKLNNRYKEIFSPAYPSLPSPLDK